MARTPGEPNGATLDTSRWPGVDTTTVVLPPPPATRLFPESKTNRTILAVSPRRLQPTSLQLTSSVLFFFATSVQFSWFIQNSSKKSYFYGYNKFGCKDEK